MEINYEILNKELKEWTNKKALELITKYGDKIDNTRIEAVYEKIATNDLLVIDENDAKFKKAHPNSKAPAAHGPRTLNDGSIHIYPFVYADSKFTMEEIIENYKTLLTHELFHCFIKLDVPNDSNYPRELVSFGHYITEGFVQLYTEKEMNKKDEKSCYRKNVVLAEEINEYLAKINRLKEIFTSDIYEILYDKRMALGYYVDKGMGNMIFDKEIEKLCGMIEKHYGSIEENKFKNLRIYYKYLTAEDRNEAYIQIQNQLNDFLIQHDLPESEDIKEEIKQIDSLNLSERKKSF